MRTLIVLGVALLLAGCIDDEEIQEVLEPEVEAEPEVIEPQIYSFDLMLLVGVGGAGGMDPAYRDWTFEVPDNATTLNGAGQWSCITMCPLEITLVDPSGEVAYQETTWGWNATVEAPAAGTWTLSVATGSAATAGVRGQLTVSVL